ncbi:hypothetical protein [Candidatus Jidaibacter acanthamoebae]|nr:hypothetical protein [Candidatus Jidaibacter acanthamoeba]
MKKNLPLLFFSFIILNIFCWLSITALSCEKHAKHKHFNHKAVIKELLNLTGVVCNEEAGDITSCTKQWMRPENKERWEIRDAENESILKNKDRIITLLNELKIYDAIDAKNSQYDYGVVLGANANAMRIRLAHLAKQIDQGVEIKQVVFLVSQRPRFENIETEEMLFDENNLYLPLKKGWVKPKKTPATETEIAKFLFEQSDLPEKLQSLPVIFVDTPGKGGLPATVKRASTSDTVIAWMKSNPKSGTILAISNPPYIGYQHAVLKKYLNPGFECETIGAPKVDPDKISIRVVLDSIAKNIENDPSFLS